MFESGKQRLTALLLFVVNRNKEAKEYSVNYYQVKLLIAYTFINVEKSCIL